MAKPLAFDDCWADVFEDAVFGGKLTRLRVGKHGGLKTPGSIIVGPGVWIRWADKKSSRVWVLPSRRVLPDCRRKRMRSKTSDIEVILAPSRSKESKASVTSSAKRRS
jgi:hypothetical protein